MIFTIRLTSKMEAILSRAEPYVGELLILTGAMMMLEDKVSLDGAPGGYANDNVDSMFFDDYEVTVEELEEGCDEADNIFEGYRQAFNLCEEIATELFRTYDFYLKDRSGESITQLGFNLVHFDEMKRIIVMEI